MQAEDTPLSVVASTPSNQTYTDRELRAMRRAALAYAAHMKLFLRRECNSTTSRHTRKRLEKVLDVVTLVERALGRDIQDVLQ